MTTYWEADFEDGRQWYVGSDVVPFHPAYYTGSIIIPTDAIGDMTNEQIGEAVRGLVWEARRCVATEIAYNVINSPSYTDQITAESCQQLEEFEGTHDSIDTALSYLRYGHPQLSQRTTPKRRKKQAGYIYVIKMGEYYKIGKTKDWKSRSRSFGLYLPEPFEEILVFKSRDISQDEANLHRSFQHKRANGEWFSLGDDDLELLREVARVVDQ